MIVRSLLLRHGRIALPRAATPFRAQQWRRLASTSFEGQKPQDFVEGAINGSKAQALNAVEVQKLQNEAGDTTLADWEFFQHQKQHTAQLGSTVTPHYKPHELLSNPPGPQDVTLELLMASQSHLGHATSLWHPANARYIFGVHGTKDPIHIISLDATAAHLRRASKIVHGVASRGGLILFVGTRDGQAGAVVKAAQMAKGCHLFDKWTPGTLTNGQQILGRCAKKVVNEVDEEMPGFEPQLFTKAAIKPDLVVCLNPMENYVLLHECGLNNIPTIGIIDTDANPTWVTYPIPANDDSLRCVTVIAGVLGRAGQQGQQERLASARKGKIVSSAVHGLTAPSEEDIEASKRGRNAQEVEDEYEDDMEENEIEGEAETYALLEGQANELLEAEAQLEEFEDRNAMLNGTTELAENEMPVLSQDEFDLLADKFGNYSEQEDDMSGEQKQELLEKARQKEGQSSE